MLGLSKDRPYRARAVHPRSDQDPICGGVRISAGHFRRWLNGAVVSAGQMIAGAWTAASQPAFEFQFPPTQFWHIGLVAFTAVALWDLGHQTPANGRTRGGCVVDSSGADLDGTKDLSGNAITAGGGGSDGSGAGSVLPDRRLSLP